jgi:serine/threonine-protein kinase
MTSSSTPPHAKTPSVIRVAPDSEQGVELLRARLSLWLGVTAALATSYDVSANVAGVLALGRSWGAQLAHPGNWAVAVEAAVIIALWWVVRHARPSLRALQLIDVSLIAMLSLVGAYLSYLCPAAVHPGLDLGAPPSANLPIGVISNIAMLSMRAALIPSTPERTLWVGSVSTLPVLLAAYLVYDKYGTPDAVNFALGTTLVSLVVIPIPVLISRVIYSLRQQVRAAEQLGHYTLESKIGEGGMGIVYRARHEFLRRPTAIKLLPARRAGATGLARFEREVLQTSRLTHPNTVAIYDYGRTADGSFYYAMEYLEGFSLEQLTQHDGPQPAGRVVHLLRQACGALAEAHRRNIIHRDVKPANLYLCVRGDIPDFVKVLDFGLAKQLESTDPKLSRPDAVLGTPLYMAPETISNPGGIDARADIYALGAVAYFLLTGSAPFQADTAVAIFVNSLRLEADSPSKRLGKPVPASLERLVLRCLEKSAGQRPASAAELGGLLAACSDVPSWSEADARRWWDERAEAVFERIRQSRRAEASSAGERSVAVDLARRVRD